MALWHCGSHQLLLDQEPLIMGILNVTPDSFSDGYPDADIAVDHAAQLIKDGAHIIDIGGESTRPGSESVSLEQELDRVIPVIRRLAQTFHLPISVDTQKAQVAREAILAGASIINHVSGTLDYQDMLPVLQETNAGYAAMHMLNRPKTMQDAPTYNDTIGDITQALLQVSQALKNHDIASERVLFDPGIGFGKTLQHNLQILNGLPQMVHKLQRPILMGLSRKSWIRELLDVSRQDLAQLDAMTDIASLQMPFPEVAVHRVHNVQWLANAFKLKKALSRPVI